VRGASAWYNGQIVAANGGSSYSSIFNLSVPGGTGYSYDVIVYYRASSGSPWAIWGISPGTFTVL
jgi:hypothetical protein